MEEDEIIWGIKRYKLEFGYKRFRDRFLLKYFTVWYEGSLVGTLDTGKDLSNGCEFHLSNGSLLKIQFTDHWLTSLDGKPIPNDLVNPYDELHDYCRGLWAAAGFLIIPGAIAFYWPFVSSIGFGLSTICMGIFSALLTIFVWRKSYAALILLGILAIADIITTFIDPAFNLRHHVHIFIWIIYLLCLPLAFSPISLLKRIQNSKQSKD